MTLLIPLFFKILLMIAIGFFLARKGLWNRVQRDGVSTLLLTVVLPANILSSCSGDSGTRLRSILASTAIFAVCYYLTAWTICRWITRRLPMNSGDQRIFPILAVFANTGFIGFPLVEQLYGREGILCLTIYNLVFFLFLFLAGEPWISGQTKSAVRHAFRSPGLLASLAGLMLLALPIRVPVPVQEFFTQVGALMTPLSMFLIGCSLADLPLRRIFLSKELYLVTFLRQLAWPAMALALLSLLPLPSLMVRVCVLTTALPAGSLACVFAEQYRCGESFAGAAVMQGTLLMTVTLPVWILLLDAFFQ